MPSARYKTLISNVAKLERRFLPKRLTGPFTIRQHDLARGFRLLAHAEIEAYLEDRAKEISLEAVRRFQSNRKPHAVTLSLVAHCIVQGELTDKYLKEKYTNQSDHLDAAVIAANNTYQYRLIQNHGIREDNILSLLLPVGFKVTEIEQAWLSQMNSFGKIRGETAHTSFAPTKLVDPKTEQTTVSQLIAGLQQIDDIFTRLKPR
jgi:hypothetical protein